MKSAGFLVKLVVIEQKFQNGLLIIHNNSTEQDS